MKIRDWLTKSPAHVTADNELLVKVGSPIQENGAIPVNVQDQTTPPLDLHFIQAIAGVVDTLGVVTAIDDISVTLNDDTGFVVGQYMGIFSGTSLEGRFYFGEVLATPGGNVIELDTPIDFEFAVGDPVIASTRDLNVNGSVTPQTFQIRGAGLGSPITIDITRIILQMTTTDPPEFSDFGDIALGLTKGIVLRRNNSIVTNIFNAKSNSDLANLMFDISFYDQALPVNVNGIAGRMTFAGQDKHGVAIRLEPGDTLDLIIQDNLSSLLSFRIIGQGHIVTD